jgi:hypothetical protein
VTRSAVDTLKIKVSSGGSVGRHRVRVEWDRRIQSESVQLDSLRIRTLQALVSLLRTNRLTQHDELKLLGEHLFVSLFGARTAERDDSSPRALFLEATSVAPREQRLTRVSVEIDKDVPALGSWPWEYLFVPDTSGDPANGFFLGDQRYFVLTRLYPLDNAEQREHIQPPLRILFVVLAPSAGDQSLTGIEYEAVLETLKELRKVQKDRVELRVLTEENDFDGKSIGKADIGDTIRTSFEAFRAMLDGFNPHVVHIIGHGRYRYGEDGTASGQIAFPKSDSTANWVSDSYLASTLRDVPSLRLVFLQACESAAAQHSPYQVISGLALRLAASNVPAVVAMHFQIRSEIANVFARAFYDTLKERTEIAVAMHAARRLLYVRGVEDESQRAGFGLPVLYLRGSGVLLAPVEAPAPPVRPVRAQVEPGQTRLHVVQGRARVRLDDIARVPAEAERHRGGRVAGARGGWDPWAERWEQR